MDDMRFPKRGDDRKASSKPPPPATSTGWGLGGPSVTDEQLYEVGAQSMTHALTPDAPLGDYRPARIGLTWSHA